MSNKNHFLVLWIAFTLSSVCALYEDQIGKFDWRHQYVGRPLYVDFDHSASNAKRVVVGTEQNVVAMLNSKNGDILWRHILEKGRTGQIDAMLQHRSYLVVVTGGGQYIRYFNMVHGDLVWEVSGLPSDQQQKAHAALAGADNDKVTVLTSSGLSVYSTSNGELRWTKQMPNSETVLYSKLVTKGEDIVVVGTSLAGQVVVVKMKSDGTMNSQNSHSAAWVTKDTSCDVVDFTHVVCLDVDGNQLHIVPLNTASTSPEAKATFHATTLQSLGLKSLQPTLAPLGRPGLAAGKILGLRLSATHLAILSLEGGALKVVKDLNDVAAIHLTAYDSQATLLAFSRTMQDNTELRGYNVDTGAEVTDLALNVAFPDHHGVAMQLAALLFRKKDGTLNLRSVVASEDHSLVMFHQAGRISWTREEALSSILAVEMLDLPVSNIQAKMEEEFGSESTDIPAMFVKRFLSQFDQLKQLILKLKAMLKTPRHHHHLTEEEDEEEDDEDEDYLTRDNFNIHKMIVATTAAGKIFGLDSPTGRIMWRHYLPNLVPFERFGMLSLPLAVQRTTSHPPNLPQCTVIGRQKNTGQALLLTLNPISGVPTEDMPPGGSVQNYAILQMALMPFMDEHFLRPLVILDQQLKYHVYPESAYQLVLDNGHHHYLFTVNSEKSLLKGYAMAAHGGQLTAMELWSVNLQKEVQTITNVVPKRTNEHVHSQGIVLGDRSVLYKYLNPNLVVITAEGMDTQQKGDGEDAVMVDVPFLNVYLVDVVSGSIVFHLNHKRAKGPVHVVHSENWVSYNYWSQKHRRTEIVVLELYEGAKQSNATVFSSLNHPPLPLVMRQAYIFPGYISTMAATLTEKGITSKHVLLAMETGGILELPKMLVDARRPLEPTQEHREEGLVPYIPELPRPFEMIINYNQSVYNIRKIHTSPAGLESTSLVMAYGLDIFFTMITPSKMFDVLKEDFDYFFIGSVLISMILVSVISQKLAARRALNRAWK